jgi:nitroreductase
MNEALQNLLTRRSCRKFKPEQVKDEELDAILEAGVYAPTGRGSQSPLILVLRKAEDVAAVERLNGGVMGNPDSHPFYGAPTVLVVFSNRDNPLSVSDANLVMGNLLNAAHAVGVDSCYIWRAKESFATPEGEALKEKWGIPANYEGAGNIILGYGEPDGIRPAAPRKEGYIIRA